MKYSRALFLLLAMTVQTSLLSNPFSCKINKEEPVQKENPIVELIYKGYAIRDDQRFAIVQYKNDQFSLKTGEQLDRYTIVDITPEYLTYKLGDKKLKSTIDQDR